MSDRFLFFAKIAGPCFVWPRTIGQRRLDALIAPLAAQCVRFATPVTLFLSRFLSTRRCNARDVYRVRQLRALRVLN